MPRFQAIFAILLLLVSVSLAVAPCQVPPNGKARGFISNLDKGYAKPTGDWLTSTYCYCHSPVRERETWKFEKAHIFQHEYYNYHSNVTFVANHLCLARAHREGDRCIRPNVEVDNMDWYPPAGKGGYICKKFERTEEEKIRQANTKRRTSREKRNAPHFKNPGVCKTHCDMGPFEPSPEEKWHHPAHDKVCFNVAMNFYGQNELELKFNRQKRKETNGDAGRVKTAYQEVRGYCEDMCQKNFKMPVDMDINDPRALGGSRQFVYTDLDDMCDNCK